MKRLSLLLAVILPLSVVGQIQPYFIAIVVEDIEVSKKWYQEMFELEETSYMADSTRGYKISILSNNELSVELLELTNSVSHNNLLKNYSPQTYIKGLFKVGFSVSNIDMYVDRVTALGTETLGKVMDDPVSDRKMLIIFDPDGNRIQLFE